MITKSPTYRFAFEVGDLFFVAVKSLNKYDFQKDHR